MDSLTHIVVGACIGEVLLPKAWGKKKIWLGALMQSLPDIDIVGSLWLTQTEDLLFHRSITHSFLFALLVSLLLSLLLKKKAREYQTSSAYLFSFFLIQVCLHDLLDTCNAYGTGLLEPFSHQRFSVHLLYVADPLFTIVPLVAFFVLLFSKSVKRKQRWALAGLSFPAVYLLAVFISKQNVNKQVLTSLKDQNIVCKNVMITPTTFNSLLWYVIAPADSGYYIGYRSAFDKNQYKTPFTFYAKHKTLVQPLAESEDVQNLIRFSQDIYTVEDAGDSLAFNVLRFGQIFGWQSTQPAPFAFHYYLDSGIDNTLVVQRGRFQGWNASTIHFMFERIVGK